MELGGNKMALTHLNNDNFDEFIKNSDRPVLVDFYADWCGPCKMVAPILEEIAEENQDIHVVKVNVDDAGAVASKFAVVNIPTLISFTNGEVHKKHVGAAPKDALLELMK